jgi:hypothetical protein
MTKGASQRIVALPPPAGTILLYAADGLSSRQGDLSPAGRPRTPKRSIWVPIFRGYIDTDEGLDTLYSLADEGMRAWDCSPDQVNSLSDAFEDITFRALSIAALEYFAATAHEKVVMSPPTATAAAPALSPDGPKPEMPQTVASIAPSSPHRPAARQWFRRLTP